MKREELQVGQLVWWKAERYCTAWSCPAVVTKIRGDRFKVQSFDDFEETDWLKLGLEVEPFLNEMRVCTVEEVRQYFKQQRRAFEDRIIEANRDLEDCREALAEYIAKTEEILPKS